MNISIAKKIAVAFGCVLFVMAATSLFTFAAVWRAQSSAEAYAKTNLVIVDLERAIAAQFDQAQVARAYLINNGVARHRHALRRCGQGIRCANGDGTQECRWPARHACRARQSRGGQCCLAT